MVYSVRERHDDSARPSGVSLGPDGRYRPVAPLPPIGGVLRELAVDRVADHRVAVARVEGGAHADVVRRHLAMVQTCRHPSLATVLEVLPDGQMIVFVGDAAMLPGVSAVIDHHSGPR